MLFTFPSRYLFTIGRTGVLRLGGWSPHVQTGFHVSRPTRGLYKSLLIRDCHPLWLSFPTYSDCIYIATGLIRVRSPLLTESRLMSFPPGTEMFQFPGFAFITLCIQVINTWFTLLLCPTACNATQGRTLKRHYNK